MDPLPVLDEYRHSFQPSPEFEQPAVLVVASGLCAPTEKDITTLRQQLVQTYAPAGVPVPNFVGTPERCSEILAGISRRLEADELMILDIVPGPLDLRLATLELLADSSGLMERASATG
jgi:alkanesulfonate monooxygenase SsuD/methylene tetrahydromethanopterin reductase-like flavin-dependent oxidoreductase (luciferase family)